MTSSNRFLLLSVLLLLIIAYSQQPALSQALLTKYENPHTGVSLSYPKTWNGPADDMYNLDCIEYKICHTRFSFPSLEILPNGDRRGTDYEILEIRTYYTFADSHENCKCDVFNEFIKSVYSNDTRLPGFLFLNDNQTTIGKGYPAWQYEYKSLDLSGTNGKTLMIFTKFNNTFYEIRYRPDYFLNNQSSFAKYLPEVKGVLDSIEFFPTDKPLTKTPSFLLHDGNS